MQRRRLAEAWRRSRSEASFAYPMFVPYVRLKELAIDLIMPFY